MQADSAHVEETRLSRSFLFVPGDSERKLEKAASAGADALILDLEDAVTPEARPAARALVAGYLPGRENVWVRVNPVDGADWEADLEAVMPVAPAGIMLPKPRHARDAVKLSERMDILENHQTSRVARRESLPSVPSGPRPCSRSTATSTRCRAWLVFPGGPRTCQRR